jgi:hypothetical protein
MADAARVFFRSPKAAFQGWDDRQSRKTKKATEAEELRLGRAASWPAPARHRQGTGRRSAGDWLDVAMQEGW